LDCYQLIYKSDEVARRICADIAGTQISPVERAALLEKIKGGTQIAKKVLEQEIATRRHLNSGDTHHDYAVAYLNSLEKHHERPAVGVEGLLYVVVNNVWQGRQLDELGVEIAIQFNGRKLCERRTDYVSIAKHAYDVSAKNNADFFDNAPLGVACPSGFINLTETGGVELDKLTPEHRQRFTLSVTPKIGNKPIFDKFLLETFASKHNEECKEQIEFLQEIMGAALAGLMAQHEKVVFMLGGGRAGKGTLLKIFEELVPKEYRSALSPFRWDKEYYLAHLAGKRLNIVGELPEDDPIPAAAFKTVTGRDLLSGRHPTHRPFEFRNEAAHIFNANNFLTTRDHSDAFFSRWLVIEFPNSRLINRGAIDPKLATHIVAEELPQILAWAMEGAARLNKRGHFVEPAPHRRLMDKWRVCTNSVAAFLLDESVCMLDPHQVVGIYVERSLFYREYTDWCHSEGRHPMGKQKVYGLLESGLGHELGVTLGRLPGSKGGTRVVFGVQVGGFPMVKEA
jgi:putative DNA primase/helicase